MENPNEQQYLKILQYMQSHPNIDYQQASKHMSRFNYDLHYQKASVESDEQNSQAAVPPMQMMDEQQYVEEQGDNQELDRMRKYLLKRMQTKSKSNRIINRSKKCVSKLCMTFTEKFIPELIKRKIIRSQFYKIYQDQAVIQLSNRTIEDAREKLKTKHKRSLIVIVSENGKNYCIVEFLKKKKVLSIMVTNLFYCVQEDNFQIVGMIESQLKTYPQLLNQRAPSVLVIRQNHLQEMQIIERFHHQQKILSIDRNTLDSLNQQIKQLQRTQAQKMKRATEKLFDMSRSVLNASHVIIPHAQYYQQQEQDDVSTYLKNKRQSKLIKNQNKEYQELIEHTKMKEQAQAEKQRKIDEVREQRQARKMSIPDEPQEDQNNSNVLQIHFRCPNGETVSHKFAKSEKCQLIFNWVDLNEDIYLQDQVYSEQGMRNFDLLHSYPPQSLRQKMNVPLSDIFQQQKVKIVIKQL